MYTIDKITLRKPTGGTGGVTQAELQAVEKRVTANENHLNQNDGKLTTAEVNIANLQTKDTQLETSLNAKLDTSTFNTEKTALTNSINTKANDNVVVKLSGNQNIDGTKTFIKHTTFAASDDDIAVSYKGRQNKACYVRFIKHDNTRTGYIGNASNQDENISVVADRGDVRISCPNNKKIDFDGKTVESSKTPTTNAMVANKKYVDDNKTALKNEIKNIAANAADFAAFKTALGNW